MDDSAKRTGAGGQSDQMKKHRATVLLLIAFFLVSIHFAEAQQRKAVFRVGVLEPGFRRPEATAPSACNSGFREGLRELGWIEGQNLRIEQRHGEFKPDQLQRFAAELVRISPEVLWTHSPPAVLAVKQATTTIPIVFGVASDVIEQGLVAGSQARPAGNITGMELRDWRSWENVWS